MFRAGPSRNAASESNKDGMDKKDNLILQSVFLFPMLPVGHFVPVLLPGEMS